jgi:hypothetical protein
LAFDDDNDKWIISDQKLRDINVMQVQVPVEGEANAYKFVKFDVAYLLRTDSGPNGGTDKIELTSTTGHKMRFWETNNVLEVKLRGETWQNIPNAKTGSRRLEGMSSPIGVDAPGVPGLDNDLHKHYLSQHYGCDVEHDEFGRPIHSTDEPVFALDGPPRGRRTKGFYGGGMGNRAGTVYVFHNGYGPDGTYVGRGDNVYYQGEECFKRNETHYECGSAMGLGGFGSAHWFLVAMSIDAAIKFW